MKLKLKLLKKEINYSLLLLFLFLSTAFYAQAEDNKYTLGGDETAGQLKIEVLKGGRYIIYRHAGGKWRKQFFDEENTPLFSLKIDKFTFVSSGDRAAFAPFLNITVKKFSEITDVGEQITTGNHQEVTKRFTGDYFGYEFSVTIKIIYNTSSPDYLIKSATIDATKIPASESISFAYGWDTYLATTDDDVESDCGYAYILPDDKKLNNSAKAERMPLPKEVVQTLHFVGTSNKIGASTMVGFFSLGRNFDRAYAASYAPDAYSYHLLSAVQDWFSFGPYNSVLTKPGNDTGQGVGYDNIPQGQITEIKTGLSFTTSLDGELDYNWNNKKELTAEIGDIVNLGLKYHSYSSTNLNNVGFQVNFPGLQIQNPGCGSTSFIQGTSSCKLGDEYYQLKNAQIAAGATANVSIPLKITTAGIWVVGANNVTNVTQTLPLGVPAKLTVHTNVSLSDNKDIYIGKCASYPITVKFPDGVVAADDVTINLTYSGDIGAFSPKPATITIPAGKNSASFTIIASSSATENSKLTIALNGTDRSYVSTIAPASVNVMITQSAGFTANIVWTAGADAESEKNNWHNPENWEPAIVPAKCHNVYIPGNSIHFPQLKNGEPAECNDIYFLYGAELGRPDLLKYERAFVQMNFGLSQYDQIKNSDDMNLVINSHSTADRRIYSAAASAENMKKNRWYMLTSPLNGVVTGDLSFGGFPLTFLKKFGPINKEGANYPVGNWTTTFRSMTEELSATEGFAFYMYGYDKLENDNTGCDESGSFNSLNDLSYLPDNYNNKNYGIKEANGIIELPFFDDINHLYAHRTQEYTSSTNTSKFYVIDDGRGINKMSDFNKFTGTQFSFSREANNGNYRFIPEIFDENNKQWIFQPVIYHSGIGLNGNDEFLVGNPYMSSLDIIKLLQDNNTTVQTNFKLWNGEQFLSYAVNAGNIFSADGTAIKYIAPMQAFILTTRSDYTERDHAVKFNVTNVSTTHPAGEPYLRSDKVEENILRVRADNPFASSYMLIGYKENASDGFRENEDVQKLFSPFNYIPEIYSLAGEIPMDINFINNRGEVIVPLGIKTGWTGEIKLTFTGMDNYFKAAKIELIDAQENRTIDLTGMSNYTYTFYHTEKGIQNGRFSLRFGNTSTALPDVNSTDDLKVYGDSKGIYVISSSSDPVRQVTVYDFQGRIIYESKSNAGYYPLKDNLSHSPLIVKVVTKTTVKSVKLGIVK